MNLSKSWGQLVDKCGKCENFEKNNHEFDRKGFFDMNVKIEEWENFSH